jgi:hypothetical protein
MPRRLSGLVAGVQTGTAWIFGTSTVVVSRHAPVGVGSMPARGSAAVPLRVPPSVVSVTV